MDNATRGRDGRECLFDCYAHGSCAPTGDSCTCAPGFQPRADFVWGPTTCALDAKASQTLFGLVAFTNVQQAVVGVAVLAAVVRAHPLVKTGTATKAAKLNLFRTATSLVLAIAAGVLVAASCAVRAAEPDRVLGTDATTSALLTAGLLCQTLFLQGCFARFFDLYASLAIINGSHGANSVLGKLVRRFGRPLLFYTTSAPSIVAAVMPIAMVAAGTTQQVSTLTTVFYACTAVSGVGTSIIVFRTVVFPLAALLRFDSSDSNSKPSHSAGGGGTGSRDTTVADVGAAEGTSSSVRTVTNSPPPPHVNPPTSPITSRFSRRIARKPEFQGLNSQQQAQALQYRWLLLKFDSVGLLGQLQIALLVSLCVAFAAVPWLQAYSAYTMTIVLGLQSFLQHFVMLVFVPTNHTSAHDASRERGSSKSKSGGGNGGGLAASPRSPTTTKSVRLGSPGPTATGATLSTASAFKSGGGGGGSSNVVAAANPVAVESVASSVAS